MEHFSEFDKTFNGALIGQHIAVEEIRKHLSHHLTNDSSNEPLILSFVGSKGSGTYTAVNLTVKAIKSLYECDKPNIHMFSASDFNDTRKVNIYKNELEEKIINEVNKFSRSIFVFQEVDNFSPGVLDVLVRHVKQDSFNKSTFILSGSIGGKTIDKIAFSRNRSRRRKDLKITDFVIDSKLKQETYERNDGWRNSAVVQNLDMIKYIPFISPERRHLLTYLRQLGAQQTHYAFTEDEYEDMVDDIPHQLVRCNRYYENGFKRAKEVFYKKLDENVKSKIKIMSKN